MHDVLVVNEGLSGDKVILPVVRQVKGEADVSSLFCWNLGAGEPQSDVEDI